jgi:hypothetical protein
MNADLTFNTIVFKKLWDLQSQSLRQSIARGVNTPDQLAIKGQDYVDSATKIAGKRYTARVDRTDIDANLNKIVTSMYFVLAIPATATQAQVDNVVATFKTVVADSTFIPGVENGET